jgi:hypothetical protein
VADHATNSETETEAETIVEATITVEDATTAGEATAHGTIENLVEGIEGMMNALETEIGTATVMIAHGTQTAATETEEAIATVSAALAKTIKTRTRRRKLWLSHPLQVLPPARP